jgi:hypothetical protein
VIPAPSRTRSLSRFLFLSPEEEKGRIRKAGREGSKEGERKVPRGKKADKESRNKGKQEGGLDEKKSKGR